MELTSTLLSNYLPYAKSTIIERAIPYIDGFKPAQRRVLYKMDELGLRKPDKQKVKSVKIIGQVMAIHPHGDSSIYESMINMSKGHNGLNVPYIDSKGSWGAVYSKIQPAAARYTEAKLAPICDELFESIKENAVDFVDNFDGTEKEPTMLPTKFPNVLVNSVAGVAVGTSSYIPSFNLINVCDATIAMLKGEVNNAEELSKVLGIPEFTTGGYLHTDEATLVKLCETGKGTFTLSGVCTPYSNKIVINEIPYNTTVEDIIDSVTYYAKSADGELREVMDIRDETGINGMSIVIDLKRGADPREVIRKLAKLTPVRKKISFRTRIIVDGRCKEMGLVELLNTWIAFRDKTLVRIYTYRKEKAVEKEHLLATWEKVNGRIMEVVEIISKNNEAEARVKLNQRFGLSEKQIDYLLDFRLKQITPERAAKSLKDLADVREDLRYYTLVLADVNERKKIIIKELTEIKEKYGVKTRTLKADLIVETNDKVQAAKISDETVHVIITESGYIKRLTTTNEILHWTPPAGEVIAKRIVAKNNENLLVFLYDGTCHKILIDDIDAGRNLKEMLYTKLNLVSKDEIMFVDNSGDYSGYFNLVYPNGRGLRVNYNKLSGPRKKYISLFEKCKPAQVFITQEDKFFIITKRLKASYIDIEDIGKIVTRMAFKIARISSGDYIMGILPEKNVPAMKFVDLDKYRKEYTVCINDDILWRRGEDVSTGTMFKPANDYVAGYLNQILEEEKARAEAYNEKMRLEAEARAAEEAATKGETVETSDIVEEAKEEVETAEDDGNLDF